MRPVKMAPQTSLVQGLVRNSLVWAGLPDPGGTRETLTAQADEETVLLRQLLDGWAELGHPATVGTAIEAVDASRAPALKVLLADLPGDKRKALGNLLRDSRGRVLDGRKLERTDHKRPKWRVVGVERGDVKASSGDTKPLVDLFDSQQLPPALA